MARTALPIALGLLSVAGDVAALKFSIKGRPTQTARSFGRRAPTTDDYGSSVLNNTQDFSYYADVVLNGTTFEALIDTGRCVFSTHPVLPRPHADSSAFILFSAQIFGSLAAFPAHLTPELRQVQ